MINSIQQFGEFGIKKLEKTEKTFRKQSSRFWGLNNIERYSEDAAAKFYR